MSVLLWILLCLVLLAGLYLFLIAPGRKRPDASALTGWLYAHRGLHGGDVPENSLAAFSRAVEAGYGIELDVQLTRDGFLVVHHDASLKRVCGADLRICDITFEELCRHPLPDGSCVPLFSDVLTLVGGRVPLIVEVKHHGGAARNAASALQQLGAYGGPYCVESFHPLAMRYFRLHAPDVVRGQLAMGGARQPGETGFIAYFALKHLLVNSLSRPALCGLFLPGGSYAGHVADAPLLSSPACRLDSAQSGGAGRRAGRGGTSFPSSRASSPGGTVPVRPVDFSPGQVYNESTPGAFAREVTK